MNAPGTRFQQATRPSALRCWRRAFSLVEVVLAVGIASIAVTALIGVLASNGMSRASESADTHIALALADSIQVELERLGFDSVETASTATLRWTAPREGLAVHPWSELSSDQYFLIELKRFQSGPLGYDRSAAWLALNVRISWPYRPIRAGALPAEPDPEVFRRRAQQVSFNVAILR